MNKNILFFDSDCLLCNKSVIFLFDHLKQDSDLYFAALNGETAKGVLSREFIEIKNTVVYFTDGNTYIRTKAIKAALENTQGLGKFFYFALLPIPVVIADVFYRLVAWSRNKILPKTYCEFRPELQKRLLT